MPERRVTLVAEKDTVEEIEAAAVNELKQSLAELHSETRFASTEEYLQYLQAFDADQITKDAVATLKENILHQIKMLTNIMCTKAVYDKTCTPPQINTTAKELSKIPEKMCNQEKFLGYTPPRMHVHMESTEMSMFPLYQWRFVNPNDNDSLILKSNYVFLNRDTCVYNGDKTGCVVSKEDPALKVDVVDIIHVSCITLVSSVYKYILLKKFDARVKQFCYGCQNAIKRRVDHMQQGCLNDLRDRVNMHAIPCHSRISTHRLNEAVDTVKHLFNIQTDVHKEIIQCLKQTDPNQALLCNNVIDQCYEFAILDTM